MKDIEQKLYDLPIRQRQEHKSTLKTALLSNMSHMQPSKKTSRKKFIWFVPALTVASLVLFIAINVLPQGDSNGDQNPIVRSLTPQQVFAASAEQARKLTAADGKYFFLNRVFMYESQNPEGGCFIHDEEEISVHGLDGKQLLSKRYGALDAHYLKLIESFDFQTNEQYFDQQTSFDARRPSEKCQNFPLLSEEETASLFMFYEKIATAYGFEGSDQKPKAAGGQMYLSDLMSGDPTLQAKTLEKLQAMEEGEYSVVTDDTSLANGEDYIKLRVEFGAAYTELYFNEATKAFIGYRDYSPMGGYHSRIVKEQKKINDFSEAVPRVKTFN